ncbi:MAG: stage II sporulation protein P [Bacilli bacterium]
MTKKFKAKPKNISIKMIILFLVFGFILYKLLLGIFSFKIINNNELLLKLILENSNHHVVTSNENLLKTIGSNLENYLKNPIKILETSFQQKIEIQTSVFFENEYTDLEDTNPLSKYITDPNPTTIDNPKVYIYNTHQLESYSNTGFENYDVVPNVLTASYLLKEKLNKQNIQTIVETSNISEFLSINGWGYSSSYKASRFYVIDALNTYSNLDLIIDLHRDSVSRDLSTITINSKQYAKIMFVVGLENPNYQTNLDLANTFNEMLNKYYPNISKGVITKQGAGVDGIYNQDLNSKMILVECGGIENSIEEVMNTMDVFSKIIKEYLGE